MTAARARAARGGDQAFAARPGARAKEAQSHGAKLVKRQEQAELPGLRLHTLDHDVVNSTHYITEHYSSTGLMNGWQTAFIDAWRSRQASNPQSSLFPLAANPFGEEEVLAMADVLLSGQLTMGANVDAAERLFAEAVGASFAVMVNSGSSANLLAVAAASNKLRRKHLNPGDEVLVPSVCWSTSVFPIVQLGLSPVFVDVSPETFNFATSEFARHMNPRVKAVMAVHVLGNSTRMDNLIDFATEHKLIVIEDTCEALGSYCQLPSGKRMLGTCGDFGTFSFYFSHHITSGEGGMVVCASEEDYNLLRCLRSHGWTRHLTNHEEVHARHPTIDPRFLFVNLGFNLRPLEVQGAMLRVQIPKLEMFNECRRSNLTRFRQVLQRDSRSTSILRVMQASPGTDPAWFGIAAVLHAKYAHRRHDYLEYLHACGVENRPIISGNFVRQPCIQIWGDTSRPDAYPGAEVLHTCGFFIGVHQWHIPDKDLENLVDIMLSFNFHSE